MAHGNSKRFYKHISQTLGEQSLDSFYRLFWIPGMSHCTSGLGHWYFGQGALIGKVTNKVNDTSHNIVLAMIDWVENDVAPDFLIGSDANNTQRTHCRYPYKSHWDGKNYVCH
jgi:feruloyl esterase